MRTRLYRNPEAACISNVDLLAVDREVHSAGSAADTEIVLGIHRERVFDQHSAACPERKAFDMTILCETARSSIGNLRRDQGLIADGAAADLHRGGYLALNQRRSS